MPRKKARSQSPNRKKQSPPEIAREWGISASKVVAWIRAGELRAIDASTRRGGRPRFLIDRADLEDFEMRRAVAVVPARLPRRKRNTKGLIEFF